jgi:tetratricopeptide (TPR) repeat protein
MRSDPIVAEGVLSFLQVRARVRFALQQPMDALEDLDACGRLEDEFEIRTPSNTSWRAEAALVLESLGRHDEAKTLAHEELERSRRYGALRPLGIALRALGMLSPGPDGLELLAEAVEVHARSQARLEHGRSLAELGAALRRAGRRREAREPLRAGIEIALHCGADALAVRAHDEFALPTCAGSAGRGNPRVAQDDSLAGDRQNLGGTPSLHVRPASLSVTCSSAKLAQPDSNVRTTSKEDP